MIKRESSPSLLQQVQELVAEQLGVDEKEVTPNASFADDFEADSLEVGRERRRGMAEEINIGNICNSSVPDVFMRALKDVLKNIADPNTPAEQKRKLTLEFTFTPHASREIGEVAFKTKTTLASVEAKKGAFFMGRKMANGDVRGYAHDPKQEELFAGEKPATPQPQ